MSRPRPCASRRRRDRVRVLVGEDPGEGAAAAPPRELPSISALALGEAVEDDPSPVDAARVDHLHALAEGAPRMDDDRRSRAASRSRAAPQRPPSGGRGPRRGLAGSFGRWNRSSPHSPSATGASARPPSQNFSIPATAASHPSSTEHGWMPDRVPDAPAVLPHDVAVELPVVRAPSRWRSSSRRPPSARAAQGPAGRRSSRRNRGGCACRRGSMRVRGDSLGNRRPAHKTRLNSGPAPRQPLPAWPTSSASSGSRVARGRTEILRGVDWRVRRGRALGHPRAQRLRQDLAPQVDHGLPRPLRRARSPSSAGMYGETDWRDLRLKVGIVTSALQASIPPGGDGAGDGRQRALRAARPLGEAHPQRRPPRREAARVRRERAHSPAGNGPSSRRASARGS